MCTELTVKYSTVVVPQYQVVRVVLDCGTLVFSSKGCHNRYSKTCPAGEDTKKEHGNWIVLGEHRVCCWVRQAIEQERSWRKNRIDIRS